MYLNVFLQTAVFIEYNKKQTVSNFNCNVSQVTLKQVCLFHFVPYHFVHQ